MLPQLSNKGKRIPMKTLTLIITAVFCFATSQTFAKDPAPSLPAKNKAPSKPDVSVSASGGVTKPVSNKELKTLKDLDKKYQGKKPVAMKVNKTLKIGLLNQERSSDGTLWMSSGRIRMELEGDEKSLLVVNKKNLWAVTFPGSDFPDAPVQVIKGDASSKKVQSQGAIGMLSLGGFLNVFNATSVQEMSSGEKRYFLMPKKTNSDFRRAQVTISADGTQITELKYWDERENETQFEFREVTFGKNEAFGKKIEDALFTYSPPAKAEIMNL